MKAFIKRQGRHKNFTKELVILQCGFYVHFMYLTLEHVVEIYIYKYICDASWIVYERYLTQILPFPVLNKNLSMLFVWSSTANFLMAFVYILCAPTQHHRPHLIPPLDPDDNSSLAQRARHAFKWNFAGNAENAMVNGRYRGE